jgi:bifunctional non-homologous end joining protein LigD
MPTRTFVPPMLATRVAKLTERPDWEYEVKWDGYRIEAIKNGPTVHLLSRRGNGYTNKFKAVAKAVATIHAETAVLDGETMVMCRLICRFTALAFLA